MITFACVLKSGGLYDAEWVRKLSRGVAEHYRGDHRFVCLSDVPVPCERVPLETRATGWWSKAELFRGGLPQGPTIYIDLDSLIVDDLTPLVDVALGAPVTLINDLYQPAKIASGVMLWDSLTHNVRPIFDAFQNDPTKRRHRMDLVFRRIIPENRPRIQDLVPGSVESLKRKAAAGPPDGCIIVAAHGPRKWVQPWAREWWEAL